jgi:hypothetical protein
VKAIRLKYDLYVESVDGHDEGLILAFNIAIGFAPEGKGGDGGLLSRGS